MFLSCFIISRGAKASRWSRGYCFVDVAERSGTIGTYNADSKGELARARRPVEIILELQNWNNNTAYIVYTTTRVANKKKKKIEHEEILITRIYL